MNIKCIKKELLLIINSKKKIYTDEYILYAFAILELLDMIKSTFTIPQDFITYIIVLHDHINCDMDIGFIRELQQNRHKLAEFINPRINSGDISEETSSSDSLSKSNSSIAESMSIGNKSIDELINEMLKKDAKVIREIMSDQEEYTDINITKNIKKKSKDEYGPLDRNLLRKAKIFFNIIDMDGDGYISANDTIKVLEFHKKNPLIFPFDLVRTVVSLLKEGKYIDFYVFVMHFL